jgi:hypothetical protein
VVFTPAAAKADDQQEVRVQQLPAFIAFYGAELGAAC